MCIAEGVFTGDLFLLKCPLKERVMNSVLLRFRSEERVAPKAFLHGCPGQGKHGNQQFDFLCFPPFSILLSPPNVH